MAIGIITNFDVNTNQPIDSKMGPYASVSEATGSINSLFRYVGQTVIITGSGAPIEYWFNPTTASTDLVLKSGGGIAGSGTQNYIPKWSNSTTLTNSQISDNGTTVNITNELNIDNNGATNGTYLKVVSNYLEYAYTSLEINPSTSGQFLDMPYLSHGIINISYNIYIRDSGGEYYSYGRAGNIQVFSTAYFPGNVLQVPFNEQTIEMYSNAGENTENIYFDFTYNNGNIQGILYNDSPTSYVFLDTEYKLL